MKEKVTKTIVTITGRDYTESWPVEPEDNIVDRVAITVQLHNRDNPENLWKYEVRENENE